MKTGSLPAKADPSLQRSFYDTVLHPLMEKARGINSPDVLLFLDASHFVMGCDFIGAVYGRVRRFVKTFSGRQRYNVLGAINYATKKVTVVTNTTYITATEICMMLRKVAAEYAGQTIHIVMDNARYQKCESVKTLAASLGIELVYIPPYSPNLNLIERVWKFVKGKLRSRYYDNFDLFQSTIDSIIEGTDSMYQDQIATLIGEKVQLFDNLQPLCENTYVPQKPSNQAAA